MFDPTEIIFASTTLCNLRCPHCFVDRKPFSLSPVDAVNFLASCRASIDCKIDKVGFSGGEPFLSMDFLCEVISFARMNNFMFDQIMTNGVWWKNECELNEALQKIKDCGYDGKIGISYDNFHGQNYKKIRTFCAAVNAIFGEENINVQAVADPLLDDKKTEQLEAELNALGEDFAADIFILPQTFKSDDERAWKSKKWFKEDFCQGPGNILFVHPSGDIAPCCGFANENKELFIGKITDSFEKIMQNAGRNAMTGLCFEKGLSSLIPSLKGKLPGKTDDICSFCDFICKAGVAGGV